jgi:hypothetical protein
MVIFKFQISMKNFTARGPESANFRSLPALPFGGVPRCLAFSFFQTFSVLQKAAAAERSRRRKK